jgi:hypothetical protein
LRFINALRYVVVSRNSLHVIKFRGVGERCECGCLLKIFTSNVGNQANFLIAHSIAKRVECKCYLLVRAQIITDVGDNQGQTWLGLVKVCEAAERFRAQSVARPQPSPSFL